MIYVVGIGPGSKEMMTLQAIEALKKADVIVGYKTYVDLVTEFCQGKEVVVNGMRGEVERCKEAIEIAKATNKDVAVISSGDAGVYGMAGLILELMSEETEKVEVKVVPGVTASLGAASILGAPMMHDFCHISLSDLLTPWEVIERRLKAAGQGDFIVCLYNPRSKGRKGHLERAFEILKEDKNASTVVGIVKNVGREKEEKHITTLQDIDFEMVDMTTIVIVGNNGTFEHEGKMITPRGYKI